MAAKSIIDIEVNDEKFKSFLSAFDDYKANVDDMPAAWKNNAKAFSDLTTEQKKAATEAQKLLNAYQRALNDEKKLAAEAKKLTDEAKKSESHYKNLVKHIKQGAKDLKKGAKHAKDMFTSITGTTMMLMKWGGILAGVTTGAGMFGFNKLIDSASNARFTAQGLGVGAGAMEAANVNYSSVVRDPTQMLASIRDVQADITKQRVLSAAGISNYQNKNAAEIAPDLIRYAQQQAKGSKGHISQMAQATGLDQIFSIDDLNRLANTTQKDVEAMIAKAKADEEELRLTDEILKKYQDLGKEIDFFEKKLKKVLVEALEPIAPNLEKLSKSAIQAFEKLMKSDKLPPLIDKLADGIGKFADYLVSPEFTKDFDSFTDALTTTAGVIKSFADGVAGALKMLGFDVPGATGATPAAGTGGIYNKLSTGIQQGIQDFIGGGAAFLGDKDAQAAEAVLNSKQQLGALSSKYEGKVGSANKDNIGSAYGKYQFNSKTGGLNRFFADNPEYAKQFEGIERDSPEFYAKWKDIARNDSGNFEAAQDRSAANIWYAPAKEKAESLGFDMSNRGVQEAVFSGSIQHGGIKKLLDRVGKNNDLKSMTPEQQLEAFYAERRKYVRENLSGGVLAAQEKRYDKESQDALNLARLSQGKPEISFSNGKGKNPPPIIIPRGEKDVNGQLKQALNRPTPEQAKSIMFQQNQGGNVNGMRLLIENNTGGNTITSAAAL